MRKRDDLPFKLKDKYVVERKVDGEKSLFYCSGKDATFEPENDVDNRVASVIADNEFLLEGYVDDETFYASDVLFYDGEDMRGEKWPTRYKILRNEFRYNSAVKMNRPLVVTEREEMEEAVKLFRLLDSSDGVLIRDYEALYGDDAIMVPNPIGVS
jgi:hypothetical protein